MIENNVDHVGKNENGWQVTKTGEYGTDYLFRATITLVGLGANLAKDGKLKVLATLLARRSHLFPDAPTMAESGFPQYSVVPWGAMVGPAGMPRDIVERVARDTNAAVNNAQAKEALDKFGFELQGSSSDELGKFIRDQLAAWRQAVKEAGIEPD